MIFFGQKNAEKINQKHQKRHKKSLGFLRDLWELRDSNPRPSACKADALNQLS